MSKALIKVKGTFSKPFLRKQPVLSIEWKVKFSRKQWTALTRFKPMQLAICRLLVWCINHSAMLPLCHAASVIIKISTAEWRKFIWLGSRSSAQLINSSALPDRLFHPGTNLLFSIYFSVNSGPLSIYSNSWVSIQDNYTVPMFILGLTVTYY